MSDAVTFRRVNSWRSGGIAYDVHATKDAAEHQTIVITAIGPDSEHRYVVVHAPYGNEGFLDQWLDGSDEERAMAAESALTGHSILTGTDPW
ncbi:MAG: hypothetical protein IH616_16075 [Gemmatimonadales bacterium]|nr:hypothetical protein [Gemmatimonadales bacterium]